MLLMECKSKYVGKEIYSDAFTFQGHSYSSTYSDWLCCCFSIWRGISSKWSARTSCAIYLGGKIIEMWLQYVFNMQSSSYICMYVSPPVTVQSHKDQAHCCFLSRAGWFCQTKVAVIQLKLMVEVSFGCILSDDILQCFYRQLAFLSALRKELKNY